MRQVTKLDFSGQKIFAGIDVHKKSWKVSIRSEHMELQTFSQKPSALDLVNHLRNTYPQADYKARFMTIMQKGNSITRKAPAIK